MAYDKNEEGEVQGMMILENGKIRFEDMHPVILEDLKRGTAWYGRRLTPDKNPLEFFEAIKNQWAGSMFSVEEI